MAPKDEALKSNKRKRVGGDKGAKPTQELKKKSKLIKSIKPDSSKKESKVSAKHDNKKEKKQEKLIKPASSKPEPLKKIQDISAKDEKSKKEMRLLAKERTEVRKKRRKPHYTLEQELSLLWEKMRRRNIAKEERSTFVTEALQKMKGKIPEIASSHISSRVLQTCVKYCSDAERDLVYEELRPHMLTLSLSTYAVHLVTKMFDNASKSQLPGLISLLHGNVARLLRHSVGSIVVEHAYQIANAIQKRELLMELYSKELQLFKDFANMKETKIVDLISKLGLRKSSVCRHMTGVLQSIWEKGIVDHSIVHKAFIEYLSIADKMSAEEVVKQLSGPLLVRIIHTRDGSRIGMLCVKHGGAKERKKLLKAMKEHMGKIIHDNCGTLVLVSILSNVDDTKLVTKVLIRALQSNLKEIILDKSARRPLLQLLQPYCQRYISPDDLACLNAVIPSLCSKVQKESCDDDGDDDMPVKLTNNNEDDLKKAESDDETPPWEADESMEPEEDTPLAEGGKKDPLLRRQELLVTSGLAESLVDVCIESREELLKSNFGKDVVYEVI
ncbi:pumilio homolog 24 [Silene latifolia]|uniref:pumilio homolog 24 n=1 Tax=Silene latifolia TaxID=37657 RepID=UPI003D76E23D